MRNVISFPKTIDSQTVVTLDTRVRLQLTDKGKVALEKRYAEVWGVDGRNARRSVGILFERGQEYVMTLREQIAYFGPLYRPIDPLDMEEDDYIVGGAVTFIPEGFVVRLGED